MMPEKTSNATLPPVGNPVSTAPILHGSVTPDGSFFFWGETSSGPVAKKRGRKPAITKLSHHPFALPAASLKKILTGLLPGQVPVIEDSQIVWLPTSDQAPEPSPEMRACAGNLQEKSTVVLHAWEIPVCRVPVSSAVPFLLSKDSGTREVRWGATLQAWGVVALFACEVVARGRYAPTIKMTKKMLTGTWYPHLPDEDKERMNELTSAMPPLVWAHLDDETHGTIAGEPVRIFLDEAVNGLVTAAIHSSPFKQDTERGEDLPVEERFYQSLLGKEYLFSKGTPAVSEIFSWLAGPKLAQSGDRCTTCFTVQEPKEDEMAWNVGFFLQSKDDPTLLVPAGEVWSGQSKAVDRLVSKETGHPQERMLYDLSLIHI